MNLQWNDFSVFHCCSLSIVFNLYRRMTDCLTSCLSIIKVSGLAVILWLGYFVSYDTNEYVDVCLVARFEYLPMHKAALRKYRDTHLEVNLVCPSPTSVLSVWQGFM